jgi:carboxypeptidase Q
MKRTFWIVLLSVCVCYFCTTAQAQEKTYGDVVKKIRKEGIQNSHIMEDVSYMTDVYGPRLPKSSSYLAAAKWAKKKFEEYGLSHVTLDPYEFGIGWQNEYTSVHMIYPQYMPLIAYPQSWSAPTHGKRSGSVVFMNFEDISTCADLDLFKGKLKGAIVFSAPKRHLEPSFQPDAVLLSEEQLDRMASIRKKTPEKDQKSRYEDRTEMHRRKIIDFLISEGALAVVFPERVYDDGVVMVTKVSGRPWERGTPPQATELVMAAEHYNRIMRILEKRIPVEMEVEIRVTYSEDDFTDYNVLAELPGTDLADEVVMVGGHLDAHAGATGAEDNATGAAQVLEAARILKAIDAKPRRTIRFALWGGEETGHMGSKAYVQKHFINPKTGTFTPEHERFSGYFNLDYGTGKIRGIYLMNNFLAQPIMDAWMKPFNDLGMTHSILIPSQDIGSDHTEFEHVGLPIFPFLQDPVENDSITFHSNMDFYDKIIPEYLMQGAVIVASFVYHAAMRNEKLPRKAID